jgi:hypothetical protein
MSALIRVIASHEEFRIEPGQRGELLVTVQNLSEIVDQYSIAVDGLAPSWYTVPVSEVSLFPQDQERVRIALHPPSGAEARAGAYDFAVRVTSRENPAERTSIPASLEVLPTLALEVGLSPQRTSSTGDGVFQVRLANPSNTDLTVDLSATDPEEGCEYRFEPSQVSVGAGQSKGASLVVRPKQKPPRGEARRYDFTVRAIPVAVPVDAQAVMGRLEHRSAIPKWLVPAVAIAAVLLCCTASSVAGMTLFGDDIQGFLAGRRDPAARPQEAAVATVAEEVAADQSGLAAAQTAQAQGLAATQTAIAASMADAESTQAAAVQAAAATQTSQAAAFVATQTALAGENAATQTAVSIQATQMAADIQATQTALAVQIAQTAEAAATQTAEAAQEGGVVIERPPMELIEKPSVREAIKDLPVVKVIPGELVKEILTKGAVGMGIAGSDDHVFAWYADGTVSSGSSWDLDQYRAPYAYALPPGKTPADIVGMGITGSDDRIFAWYGDGTVSSGSSGDLDQYRAPYAYVLPPGKTPADIVGMGIAGSDDHVFVWYRDGTVSSGSSSKLAQHRAPYAYTLPPGKTPGDIMGMGIAGSNDHVFAWYRDGTVSSGSSSDLDQHRAPYPYSLPSGK